MYERGDRIPRVDTLTRIIAASGSALELVVIPPAPLDMSANGRSLEAVLALADALPQRPRGQLDAPPFADLIERARTRP